MICTCDPSSSDTIFAGHHSFTRTVETAENPSENTANVFDFINIHVEAYFTVFGECKNTMTRDFSPPPPQIH